MAEKIKQQVDEKQRVTDQPTKVAILDENMNIIM